MKKAKSDSRPSAAKHKLAQSVDEYLAGVPEPAQTTLSQIRRVIRSVVPPEATETIGYRIPSFKFKGWLVGYAAFANHCSFFPGALPRKFATELKGFSTSKGTIRFPLGKPLSAALVKKIVKARIKENEARAKKKAA